MSLIIKIIILNPPRSTLDSSHHTPDKAPSPKPLSTNDSESDLNNRSSEEKEVQGKGPAEVRIFKYFFNSKNISKLI